MLFPPYGNEPLDGGYLVSSASSTHSLNAPSPPIWDSSGPEANSCAPPVTVRAAQGEAVAWLRPVLQILGHVGLSGPQWRLTSQQLSLIAYLAVHGPATREGLVEALWGGRAVSAGRLANLVSQTRSVVGRRHLPDAEDGRYQLCGITTDLAQFHGLLEVVDNAASPQDTIGQLCEVLRLVRGTPFSGLNGRYWTWPSATPGLISSMEILISDTAVRLVDLVVDAGDLTTARWACEHALRAVPLDESLTARLVDVYLGLAKPATARRLVEEGEVAVRRLDCGSPSPVIRQRLQRLQRPQGDAGSGAHRNRGNH